MNSEISLRSRFLFLFCLVIGITTGLHSAEGTGKEATPNIEIVARLDVAPGNITVTPDGRILVSLHQHFQPELRVAEVLESGTLRPFPNRDWNNIERPDGERLDSVLGLQTDTKGIVWLLDNGMRSDVTPKLVGWNLDEDRIEKIIELPVPVSREDSFLNDLAVDRTHNTIYIADPTRGDHPAIIVVDIPSGTARRVLEGHTSVVPEPIDLVIDRTPVQIRRPDGSTFRPRVGINPIALDAENEWLYYGPMHGTAMYRIRTSDLNNEDLSGEQLAERVERFGNKPISDGSSVSDAGEVYISDVGNYAIGMITPEGSYVQLIQDPRMLKWTDAFSFGPDDWCYAAVNQLHLGPVLNAGDDETEAPYLIVRFRRDTGGVTGR